MVQVGNQTWLFGVCYILEARQGKGGSPMWATFSVDKQDRREMALSAAASKTKQAEQEQNKQGLQK